MNQNPYSMKSAKAMAEPFNKDIALELSNSLKRKNTIIRCLEVASICGIALIILSAIFS